MVVHVRTFDTESPGDPRGLRGALADFPATRIRRAAILAKTEGHAGGNNDYSREVGTMTAQRVLDEHGGESLAARTALLYSTGSEGALTPFGYLFVDVDDEADRVDAPLPRPGDARLVFTTASGTPVRGADLGTLAHVDNVARAVEAAMAELDVTADDVELVILKSPLRSSLGADRQLRITSARAKAAGALGSAVALGEVDRSRLTEAAIGTDLELHSNRTMVFSSSATEYAEVLLFANRAGAGGDLVIRSGLISDVLDAPGLSSVLADAGLPLTTTGALAAPDRMAAMLIKAGIASDGRLRGRRTTMRTSELDSDKHVRATMSGTAGAVVGTGRIFVSSNTVHQAPDGGGLCAVIAVCDDSNAGS